MEATAVKVPATMKAWVYKRRFEGRPDETYPLEAAEDYPVPKLTSHGTVLVQVRAATVNPVDWKIIGGSFRYVPTFLGAPRFDSRLGTIPCADGAGVVVESRSQQLPVGTEVSFDVGADFAALAEYCVVSERNATPKPKNVSFEEAAANVGLASGTAVMGLDWLLARLEGAPAPLSFVVLGGGGGVGSAAICYLKALGHRVTTTCSERNAEWCRRLGADVLLDHTKVKWYEALEAGSVDAVFQAVGTAGDYDNAYRVLSARGVFASCDAEAPLSAIGRTIFYSRYYYFLNKPCTANLKKTADAMEAAGERWPSNLGHTFEFAEADKAFALSRSGKATGKIVIRIP